MKPIRAARSARRAGLSLLFLALMLVPLTVAHADIGDKPTMDFEFLFEADTDLTIVEATLMECEDSLCQDAEPLPELGPQRLSCEADHCSAMAYGFSDYHQLVIEFSDGKTRRSNVFETGKFHANYRVRVRQEDMLLEYRGGQPNMFGTLFLGLIGVGFLFGLLILLILLIVRAGKDAASFKDSRAIYIAAWVLLIPVILIGAYISWAIPATFAIEGLGALLYALVRRRSKITSLTAVLLANAFTLPLLWLGLSALSGSNTLAITLAAEALVWLIESAILYLPQRRTLRFVEAALLSLGLNAVSFGLGLLMPF